MVILFLSFLYFTKSVSKLTDNFVKFIVIYEVIFYDLNFLCIFSPSLLDMKNHEHMPLMGKNSQH